MYQIKEGIPNVILDKPICWAMINMDEVNKVPFSQCIGVRACKFGGGGADVSLPDER